MKVYVIKQYQPYACYNGEPIGVYDNYEHAREQCKKLNDSYLKGVIISENMYSFTIDEHWCYDDIHCYTIEEFKLNQNVM